MPYLRERGEVGRMFQRHIVPTWLTFLQVAGREGSGRSKRGGRGCCEEGEGGRGQAWQEEAWDKEGWSQKPGDEDEDDAILYVRPLKAFGHSLVSLGWQDQLTRADVECLYGFQAARVNPGASASVCLCQHGSRS